MARGKSGGSKGSKGGGSVKHWGGPPGGKADAGGKGSGPTITHGINPGRPHGKSGK